MKGQKRIRNFGIFIGDMETGGRNSITDVEGVTVGHSTIDCGRARTGVTAIMPHRGNIFREKLIAASHVINGFGKSIGTIQINEMGTIETPIILTNTLAIGTAADALIEYMLEKNPDIGDTTCTVNPIVCECNDGYLNDIRAGSVSRENIFAAIENAGAEFLEGGFGAGTGMSCFGMKGGIGTASRVFYQEGKKYTVGALVLSNFGRREDFILGGIKAGKIIAGMDREYEAREDRGSIITIIATDIPVTERQLARVCRRGVVGIVRTGSHVGNGSGDIVIGFTTANRVNHYAEETITHIGMFNENRIDTVFRAAEESVEEAILNSLICADTTVGRDGHIRHSLKEYIGGILK